MTVYQASSPSNIAFVKYWGKLPDAAQVAANSSLSMTLAGCEAITRCQLIPASAAAGDHEVVFGDRPIHRDDKGGRKIFRHLDRMVASAATAPSHWSGFFRVNTYNTFPTSAGIASSAAGISALTVAAAAAMVDSADWQILAEQGFDRAKLADLARLGSGSAGRSLWGGFVKWTSGAEVDQGLEQMWSEDHWHLCDTIAVLSSREKAVSSTDAHREVWTSPLFKLRLATLPHTLEVMEAAIASRDIEALGAALEQEAINMHSVSMTAERSITFPSEGSFALMTALKTWRRDSGLKAYFTLDAGENVHIIHEADQLPALQAKLSSWPGIQDILHDSVGAGPRVVALDSDTL